MNLMDEICFTKLDLSCTIWYENYSNNEVAGFKIGSCWIYMRLMKNEDKEFVFV